jgi:hypothetical protein
VTNTNSRDLSNSSNVIVANPSYAGQPVSGKTRRGFASPGRLLLWRNTADHNTRRIELNAVDGDEVRATTLPTQRRAARRHSPTALVTGARELPTSEDSHQVLCGRTTALVNNVSYGNGDHGLDNYQTTGQSG